ncbi:MAG TPA: FHA domain-containing protein, partial [Armatimonadota bacterium]|nr:FHA domain-containing protein [Armatimonadota bacterium]
PTHAAAAPASGDSDWDFLRSQPDFDAEEMASVRSVANALLEPVEQRTALKGAPVLQGDDSGAGSDLGTLRVQVTGATLPALDAETGGGLGSGRLGLEVTALRSSFQATVGEGAIIGRRSEESLPDVDLAGDEAVSPRHAGIFLRDDRYWLRDLDSQYGTRHNGRLVTPGTEVVLQAGDVVEIGNFSRIHVVEISADPTLSSEDVALGALLQEALGTPVAPAPRLPAAPPAPRRARANDVLDVALDYGGAVGLLRNCGPCPQDTATLGSPDRGILQGLVNDEDPFDS